MKKIGMVIAVGLAVLAWGYGDLPSTFDATTGYVTMETKDGAPAGNQSFYLGANYKQTGMSIIFR